MVSPLLAQGPLPEAPRAAVEPATSTFLVRSTPERSHRFLDRYNIALFAATAALAGTDFAVTRSNLQNNGHELNPVVRVFGRSTTGLALNFAGETLGTIGASYFFHKTGHHKLERIVSATNIGISASAVGYSVSHQ